MQVGTQRGEGGSVRVASLTIFVTEDRTDSLMLKYSKVVPKEVSSLPTDVTGFSPVSPESEAAIRLTRAINSASIISQAPANAHIHIPVANRPGNFWKMAKERSLEFSTFPKGDLTRNPDG